MLIRGSIVTASSVITADSALGGKILKVNDEYI